VALAVLAAWWTSRQLAWPRPSELTGSKLVLLASPLLLAVVQLTPLPPQTWLALPGHDAFAAAMKAAGVPADRWRPMSIDPEATLASLLAALPLMAAFVMGHESTSRQLRWMMRVLLAVALAQVALGLFQVAGGQNSPLYFGMMSFGPAIGTFPNRNLLGNYLALSLIGCLWLAYEAHRRSGQHSLRRAFQEKHQLALWGGAAFLLVVGILATRSRGTVVFGSLAAVAVFAVIAIRIQGFTRGWRIVLPIAPLVLLAAVTLVGIETLQSRLDMSQLTSSAGFRGELARTSLQAAAEFWPLGSGLGTYREAYPRFQPPWLPGFANHAHQDYVELLVEAGALFAALALLFAWLALRRVLELVRRSRSGYPLESDAMASLVFGIGLAGFLAHAMIDFPMRIPANAIVAALFAGAFLRPLRDPGTPSESIWQPTR
jgi:O-antigen ligase